MGVSASIGKMLDRKAFLPATAQSNSTADRNDHLAGTVEHRFMQMMKVHDRMRNRFLTSPQPRQQSRFG